MRSMLASPVSPAMPLYADLVCQNASNKAKAQRYGAFVSISRRGTLACVGFSCLLSFFQSVCTLRYYPMPTLSPAQPLGRSCLLRASPVSCALVVYIILSPSTASVERSRIHRITSWLKAASTSHASTFNNPRLALPLLFFSFSSVSRTLSPAPLSSQTVPSSRLIHSNRDTATHISPPSPPYTLI